VHDHPRSPIDCEVAHVPASTAEALVGEVLVLLLKQPDASTATMTTVENVRIMMSALRYGIGAASPCL
jgi:hypothetical protein